ncbi:MAG: ABC transporter permease [Bryobacteraceae bacterium]
MRSLARKSGAGAFAYQPHPTARVVGFRARLREGLLGETVTALWLRLRALAGRRRLDRDLEDELAFHIAMREEQHRAEGMPPAEARAAARRELGNATAWKETSRDMWTFARLETVWQDLRYGARQLRRSPGFAFTCALTLGLGIGATTAIFSMFDAVLWRPIPLPHLEQLAIVLQQGPDPHFPVSAAPADVADIARAQTSLTSLASWMLVPASIVDAGGEPLRVEAARVTPNFFQVMGVAPAFGRVFDADSGQPGHDRVVLMSDNLWRRHFAADPAIVGRAIRINNQNYTVAGVMPPGFQFPRAWRDLWMPLALTPADRGSRDKGILESAGRLKPGRTLPQFAAELAAIARELERQHPDSNHGRRFAAWPISRYMGGDYIPVYEAMLMGAALFVLLIACANVANLQFARSMGRWREVAVRAALGAGRRRIVRQLVTESLLLALAAAVLGLIAARFGLAAIKANVPVEMRRYMTGWEDIGLSLRALAVAFAAAAASGILAGLAPAWRCSRPNLIESLKEGGRGGLTRRGSRLRSLLVAAEMALAVVLLTGAGLMVRSFSLIVAGSASLDPSTMLTLRLRLEETRYPEPAQVAGFYRDVLARVRALPAVTSASIVTALPFSRFATSLPFAIEGQARQPERPPSVMVQSVSTDYFRALHIPLRAGRLIGDTDGPESPRVAIVSERMARRWWPARSPLGQRIRLGESGPWITIAGVVGDIVHSVMDSQPRSIVYLPYLQAPVHDMNLGLRVSGDPLRLAPAVTAVLRAVDREQPVDNVATLATLIRQEAFVFAYMAALMGVLGAIALVLAAAGIYGVTAYAVAGQTREIGIRTALGASPRSVLAALFRQGLWTAGAGLAVGMIPALGMARLLAFAIWGVRPADPLILGGIPLLLAASAALAIWIPARKALRIDPLAALRCE